MQHDNKNARVPTSEHTDVLTYPLKVMDNVSGVAASEVWHGYTDLLVVVVQVDANILL